MTKAQRIIKYIVISLAVLLIVSIFSTIIVIVSNIFGLSFYQETNEYKITEINNKIDILDIELKNSNLIFKYDNVFKVEGNNEKLIIKERNNKLTINEKSSLLNNDISEEVIVYLPENYVFNEVSIESGAGSIVIDELQTKELELDLGAGSINISNLNVLSNASIDTGAGQVEFNNCNINNLDIDIGIGKTIINGILTGANDIDAGIGELQLNLNNSINNYNLIIDKGIGEIKVNNISVNNHYFSNNGNAKIEINGGIGTISINTIDRDF